tara:strand:- start:4193 stop:4711 length:519 start_codon:yes stop_codon:yes gene_type:complete
MPRKAMDYSKTIIYKIQHEDNEDLVYVGHTTDFVKRKYTHKSDCNNEKGKKFNLKLYTMIRENGGWECFKMVMVEEYPCVNHLEACRREDECMRQLKSTMNGRGAVLDKEKIKQYREANKEKLSEQMKHWYEANKEKCLEKSKHWYEANRDEINHKRRERYQAKKELKIKIS